MTNNTNIQSLIENLEISVAQAEHKPGDWASSPTQMGGVVTKKDLDNYLINFMSSTEGNGFPKPWASFNYKRDGWLAIQAVNALPSLLAYIKQLEQGKSHERES